MSINRANLISAAIAALLLAIVVVTVLGTGKGWFRCDGENAYAIGHVLNLGGCKPK